MRGARPHTASHGLSLSASHSLSSPRPHTICHVICLSQSGEHGLTRPPRNTRPLPRPVESDRHLGLPTLASQIGLPRPHRSASQSQSCDLSESPICEAVGFRARPHRSASHGLSRPHRSASQSHVICQRVWSVRPICEAVGVQARPHRSASHGLTDWPQIGLTDRTLWQITWLTLLGRSVRPCEAVWGWSVRPCSDSHGLTDRPHKLDSLTDWTLWQIWQIDQMCHKSLTSCFLF